MLRIFFVTLLLLYSGLLFANPDIAHGKQLAVACSACHGADGNSSNVIYPNIAGQSTRYFVDQLQQFKDGKRNNALMTGITSQLSLKDMEDLAAYLASLKPTHGLASPELVELGQSIYRGGDLATGLPACMACHGPQGRGNNEAGFPALGGQHADYIFSQLKAYKDGTRPPGVADIMKDIANKMKKEEMLAVASYIQGLH